MANELDINQLISQLHAIREIIAVSKTLKKGEVVALSKEEIDSLHIVFDNIKLLSSEIDERLEAAIEFDDKAGRVELNKLKFVLNLIGSKNLKAFASEYNLDIVNPDNPTQQTVTEAPKPVKKDIESVSTHPPTNSMGVIGMTPAPIPETPKKPLEKIAEAVKASPTKKSPKPKKSKPEKALVDSSADEEIKNSTVKSSAARKLEKVSQDTATKLDTPIPDNVVELPKRAEKQKVDESSKSSKMTPEQRFAIAHMKALAELEKQQAKKMQVEEDRRHHLKFEQIEEEKLRIRAIEAENTRNLEEGKTARHKESVKHDNYATRMHSKNIVNRIGYLSSDVGMALEKDKLKTERKKSNDSLKRAQESRKRAELALEKEKLRSITKEKAQLHQKEMQRIRDKHREDAEKKRKSDKLHDNIYGGLKEMSPSMAYAYGGSKWIIDKLKEKKSTDQSQDKKEDGGGDSIIGDLIGSAIGGIIGNTRLKAVKRVFGKFGKFGGATKASAGAAAGASVIIPNVGGNTPTVGGGQPPNNPPPVDNKKGGKIVGSLTKLSKVLGRGIPLVSGLVSLVDSLSDGETFGKALSKGAGAAAGGLGGASLGAAIGTMLLPGIGTAIGAILGGLGGALAGEKVAGAAYDGLSYAFSTKEEKELARGKEKNNFVFGKDRGLYSSGELAAFGRKGWTAPPDINKTVDPEVEKKQWEEIKEKNAKDNNPFGINGYVGKSEHQVATEKIEQKKEAIRQPKKVEGQLFGVDSDKIKNHPSFQKHYQYGLEIYGSDRGGQYKAYRYAAMKVKQEMSTAGTTPEAPKEVKPNVAPVAPKGKTPNVTRPQAPAHTGRTFTPTPRQLPRGATTGNTPPVVRGTTPPKRVENGDGVLSRDIERDFIKQQEGFSGKSYKDAHGQSIGYGHFFTKEEKERGSIKIGDEYVPLDAELTREQADTLLEQDIASHRNRAIKGLEGGEETWNLLNDNQKAALSSYVYNGGYMSTLNKNGFSDYIKRGDTENAARVLREHGTRTSKKYAGGPSVVNPTLVKRRGEEADFFNKRQDNKKQDSASVDGNISSKMDTIPATPEKAVKDDLVNAQSAIDNKQASTEKAPKAVNIVAGGSPSSNVNNVSTTYVNAPELDPTIRHANSNNLFPARV